MFEGSVRPKLLMQLFRDRRCFDPRDKVYAFLGVFKKIDEKSVLPSPDYNKPVREVYIEAARAFGVEVGLLFLHFRESRSSNQYNLPSWVPNFQLGSGVLQMDDPLADTSYLKAASGLGPSTLTFKDHGRLGTAGCYVDTVVRPEPFHFQLGTMGSTFRHLLETLRCIPEESVIASPPSNVQEYQLHGSDDAIDSTTTKQSRFEVLWRTLIQDMRRDCHPAPPEIGKRLRKRLDGLFATQYLYIVMNETIQLLEQLKQDGSHLCTEFSEVLEGNKHGLWMMSFVPAGPDIKYDSKVQEDALFEMNAVIEMLDGNISMESEERPPPKAWARHKLLWDNAKAALKTGDQALIAESLGKAAENISFFPMPTEDWDNLDGYNGTRMLFATSGGRLGLTAVGIERGDEIWILPGLNVPVALRRVGDGSYSLVGVTYVHGIMHGEAVPDSKEVVEFDLI